MLTTAGITFATARTTGSEAGSVGDDDGNGVGVCANKDCTANKRMIAVVDASMRAPPRTIAFNVPLYCILGFYEISAQVTGRRFHCQLAHSLLFTTLS